MMYTNKYSKDQLFDMFANQADFTQLAKQSVARIAADLKELAPDMEDANQVALNIKVTAKKYSKDQLFELSANQAD